MFAMGRHVLVDLATVFSTVPSSPRADRLPAELFSRRRSAIASHKTPLRPELVSEPELKKLRAMYEAYANALSVYFLIALPPWIPAERTYDNWQITEWEHTAAPFAVSDAFLKESDQL
jgi:hypothetical protein